MAHTEDYSQTQFPDAVAAQHSFANHFDMTDPHRAMSVYARVMHQHTKNQLDTATNSARRRSRTSPTSSMPAASSVNGITSPPSS